MILIIGFGNSLRRDDGAGPALANMVLAHESFEDIRIIKAHQLTPELAEEVAAPDVSAVIFMDSCVVQRTEWCVMPGCRCGVETHRQQSCIAEFFASM